MTSFNVNKIRINQKDIEKGQKIVAAIYLLTNHLPENDTIRQALRSLSVSLVKTSFLEQSSILSQIEMLLGAATLSGLITEKNSSIVIYEAKHFCEILNNEENLPSMKDLFTNNETNKIQETNPIKDIKKTQNIDPYKSQGHFNHPMSYKKNPLNKVTREDKILAFINDRKSAVIKDITSLFPDVSEKTVQRELSKLIDSGRIIKRGSKRWSIYMAVNSLL
jgi:hypothetical protein